MPPPPPPSQPLGDPRVPLAATMAPESTTAASFLHPPQPLAARLPRLQLPMVRLSLSWPASPSPHSTSSALVPCRCSFSTLTTTSLCFPQLLGHRSIRRLHHRQEFIPLRQPEQCAPRCSVHCLTKLGRNLPAPPKAAKWPALVHV